MASYYVAQPGIYTVCYCSTQIAGFQLVLLDQKIAPPEQEGNFNSDSNINGRISGSIDGTNKIFYLSAPPVPPTSLILALNGLVVLRYAFSGTAIVFESAPPRGSTINATCMTVNTVQQ
jgi:hypothetical protein